MIEYDEDWIISLIPKTKGSVFNRALLFAIPASITAFCLVAIDDVFPGLRDEAGLPELKSSQLWTASYAILGILLGFRTNRAMARFWEGTGLLHQMRGEWFDSVSCCVTFSRAGQEKKWVNVRNFRHTIVRLMSLCHGSALEEIAGDKGDCISTIDSFGLDNATLNHLKICNEEHHFNRVEVLLHLIQTLITQGLRDEILVIPPPILSRVYQTLSRGFVNLLNAKKIADTRFPFPFAQLIALLLMIHLVSTPILISALTPSKFWAPFFTFLPIFGMFSLNFVGIELENPFGDDDNDLPLDHFQTEMNTCLLMLLHDNADLMPGISEKRCKLDFRDIEEELNYAAHHPGDEDEGLPTPNARRRLSHFEQYIDITDVMAERSREESDEGDETQMTEPPEKEKGTDALPTDQMPVHVAEVPAKTPEPLPEPPDATYPVNGVAGMSNRLFPPPPDPGQLEDPSPAARLGGGSSPSGPGLAEAPGEQPSPIGFEAGTTLQNRGKVSPSSNGAARSERWAQGSTFGVENGEGLSGGTNGEDQRFVMDLSRAMNRLVEPGGGQEAPEPPPNEHGRV
eukprot:TRINITY_DN2142_c0_g1_i2.p1 TRINITY_DN2142_c0_g1~~TRINITY_DN2142_c0_g1_i2.p1  ORF type:complete len:569 (-),score=111.11 TRINITY_DN2142_c0_g1_i2:509-2215(-)